MAAGMENIYVGLEVIGKFQFSRGIGMRPSLGFPHGTVTEVGEKTFKVKYLGIKGEWTHRESEIGKNVYLPEMHGKVEQQKDHLSEQERLGIEE